jgi:hypothetical protein
MVIRAYSYDYYHCYIIYYCHTLLIMSLLIVLSPLAGEVELAEYVCTHMFIVVFLAADPDYVLEKFE